MKPVRSVRWGLVLLAILLTVKTTNLNSQPLSIKVGPNVQVSAASPQLVHGEVLMGADPTHAGWLIGCSMVFPDPLTRRISDSVTYVSHDGGAHWAQTLYVKEGEYGAGDPACGFGIDGKAYSVFLAPPVKSEADDVVIYRSDDGGETWSAPLFIDSHIDREYITVDATGGKYNGHIYINGTGSARRMDQNPTADLESASAEIGISIQRSIDGGISFKAPLRRFSTPPHFVLGMGNGVVLSDGTYVAVFGDLKDYKLAQEKRPVKANAWLKMISSTDGGVSFSNASVISDWNMDYGEIASTSSIVPVIAVDRTQGPFRDRLYVVWPDYRSGRGQVLLSYSSDKGKKWSKPIVVDDNRAWPEPAKGPDNVMPAVAVNNNGVVGVMWYDRRDNPHNYGWWVRLAASQDGGETFGPSIRVSEKPATIPLGPQLQVNGFSSGGGKPTSPQKGGNLQVGISYGNLFSFNGGHTVGMAADAGGDYHPFWIDNRTGVSQIWSAAVSIEGAAIVNGSKELSELQDVSDKVTLDLKSGKFDRATGLLTIDAYLGNTSEQTLKTPIKMRVITLESKMGQPTIVNAENQQPAAGAVWDFSDQIADKSKGFAPGEVAAPKRLTFRLTDVAWGDNPPSADDLSRFLNFEAKVLAPKPEEKKGK